MTDDENTEAKSIKKDGAPSKKPPEAANTDTGKAATDEASKPSNWSVRILFILVVFLSGMAVSIYFIPALKERLPFVANWIGESNTPDLARINEQITTQQREIDTLKQDVASLDFSLGQLSSNGAAEDMTDTGNITDVRATQERIGILEQRMEQLSRSAPSDQPDTSQSARIDMLLSRMSQLEASFVPLSKNMVDAAQAEKERRELQSNSAGLSDKISEIENRIENVEKAAAKDNSGILLNLKVGELKRKLISGRPFQKELSNLNELVSGTSLTDNIRVTSALDYLSQYAVSGLPTPDQLSTRFNSLVPELMNTKGMDENAPWWQKTLNAIKNMITVRKTGNFPPSDESADSIIAQIENGLSDEELEPIVDLIATMPAAMQSVLRDWKTSLESWLRSENAIYDLESAASESYLTNSPSRQRMTGETAS